MIIAAEFLWLFILAERQESHTKKYSEASRQIDAAFDAVLYAPTGESRKEEIAALAEFVGDNPLKMDILSGKNPRRADGRRFRRGAAGARWR